MKKCVVLFSGGLDSSTCLALALHDGFEVFPLIIDYGQRHSVEMERAKGFLEHYRAIPDHRERLRDALLFRLDLRQVGGSSLTEEGVEVVSSGDGDDAIPSTYVPARNTIFLSIALAYAELVGADHIFIGVNAIDYSGYPDCRPEYVKAFQEMASLATKRGVEGRPATIHTPLIDLKKSEIIRKGLELEVPYELTWSCYRGEEPACGSCDSCVLRLRGFEEAGVEDPVEYKKR